METSYEIYLITAPGYWYVGCASGKLSTAKKRFTQHMGGVKSSGAPKLCSAIQEIGKESFHQVVVERGCGNPLEAEQAWYDFYFAHDARQSLNSHRPGGTPNAGRKLSAEHKAKISAAHVGLKLPPLTPEHKAQISKVHKGRIKGPYRISTSGYNGVSVHKKSGKWCARVLKNGERLFLGLFDDPYEAHLAVEAAR